MVVGPEKLMWGGKSFDSCGARLEAMQMQNER